MSKIFLLLVVSLPVFAVDSIYAWGYGEDIKNILISIKFLTGNATYLINAAIVIGILLVMYRETQEDNVHRIAKVIFLSLVVSQLFFHSTKNVMVEDEVTNQAFAVTNVPVGIVELYSIFTTLERSLIHAFEASFSTPNSLNYSEVGLGFSMAAHLATNNASFVDGYAHETFMDYTTNCIASGMLDGQIDKNLIASEDIVGNIRVTGFETIVYKSDGSTEQVSCQDSYDNYIVNYFQNEANGYIQNRLAAQLNLDPLIVKKGLQDTSSVFFGVSKSGQDYVMQQTGKNMLKKGLKVMAMTTGGDTQALAYGSALSSASMENQWQQSGMMAQSTLPMIKAYLTSVILAMTPMLALLAIMFGDWKYIKMITTLLTTLMLFSPLAAVINYLMYLKLEDTIPIMDQGLWMPMLAMIDINSQVFSYLNFLGYATMSIPLLAYSLVKASEMGFVNFMSSMGGSVSSAANTGAGQKVTGVTLGNTKVGGGSHTGVDGVTTAMGGGATQNNSIQSTNVGSYSDQTNTSVNGSTNSTLNNSVADITTKNGELSSIGYKNLGADITASHQSSYNQAKATESSTLASLSSTLSAGLSQSMAQGQIYTNSDDFSKNTGMSAADSRAIVQSQQEAIVESLNKKLSEAQTSGSTADAGFKLNNHVGWGTQDTVIGAISGFKIGTDGSYQISGTSTDGQSFTADLSKDEMANIQNSVSDNLTKTFSQDNGLALRTSKSLADNEVFSNTDLKSNMDAYSKAHSIAEKYSENYSKTDSDSISFASKVMPEITKQFIANDERLSYMYDSGDPRAMKDALSDASYRIDKAYKNGVGADFDNLNSAFINVTGFDTKGNVENIVDGNITSGQQLDQSVHTTVATGQNDLQNRNVNNTINQNPTNAYNTEANSFGNNTDENMNQHKDNVALNNKGAITQGGDGITERREEFVDTMKTEKAFKEITELKNNSGVDISDLKTKLDYLQDDVQSSKYESITPIETKKVK